MKDSEMMALLERVVEIEEDLAAVKPLYKEREEIMAKLIGVMPPIVKMEGFAVVLKDNYAAKNVQWKAASFSRYELEVVKREE